MLPVEGGARIAILEAGHRLNADAQNVLLKTLEEPPAGVSILICADDEDRLLPTIQSRVARIRLGTVAPREIEALLEERGEADAPTANRLARLAAGRPGLAVAYARAPEAAAVRGELSRSLLDLTAAPRAIRLARIRELLARAKELRAALSIMDAPSAAAEAPSVRRRGRASGGAGGTAGPPANAGSGGAASSADADAPTDADAEAARAGGRATAADRRGDAALLFDIWRDLARDLVLVGLGDAAAVREPDLLEELEAVAAGLSGAALGAFLVRLDTAGQALEVNVSPELAADVLVLAWPRSTRAA